ncbi:MAG: hypothetical protein WEB00_12895 [Dehalococcoidia bacterium]
MAESATSTAAIGAFGHKAHSGAGEAITPDTNVGDLIDNYPGILEVLEEYGIRMDPFTYILLRGSVREAAEYSAVSDLETFRRALAEHIAEHQG